MFLNKKILFAVLMTTYTTNKRTCRNKIVFDFFHILAINGMTICVNIAICIISQIR